MNRILPFVVLLAITQFASANESYWQNNYKEALSKGEREDKLLLIFFTGSDWCHWCQKLERELFSEIKFKNDLPTLAVPLQVDFPMRGKISPKQKRHNQILKEKFKVEAFPTVIILDPVSGKQLLRHSYTSEGTEAYLKILKDLKTQLSEKS